MEEKKRICLIQKGLSGFGFILCCETDSTDTYVLHVLSSTPSSAAGLKAGDRIIEVNGINVERESHKDVVERLQDLQSVRLLVAHNSAVENYFNERGNGMTVKPLEEYDNGLRPKLITVTRTKEGFDFVLQTLGKSRITPNGGHRQQLKGISGHYVGIVLLGGVAHKAGLKQGDRIIEINGISIEKETHAYIIALIKSSQSIEMLVVNNDTDEFFRRHGVAPTSKHLTGTLDFGGDPASFSVRTAENHFEKVSHTKKNHLLRNKSNPKPRENERITKSFQNNHNLRKIALSNPDLSTTEKVTSVIQKDACDDIFVEHAHGRQRTAKAKKEIKKQLSKLEKQKPSINRPKKIISSNNRSLYDETDINDNNTENIPIKEHPSISYLNLGSSTETIETVRNRTEETSHLECVPIMQKETPQLESQAINADHKLPREESPPPVYELPTDLSNIEYNVDLKTLKDRVRRKSEQLKTANVKNQSKLSQYQFTYALQNS